MAKSKLERFADIDEFENVFELTDFQKDSNAKPKGLWREKIFQNENPVVLELACGKGEYTVELAEKEPCRNFVGIDIKGSRLWKGARKARDEGLKNVRFLRIYIDHLSEYFAAREVDEIWITFPDPYLKGGDRNKRLTSERFLNTYQSLLKKPGLIHLKTDSKPLFEFTEYMVNDFGGTVIERVEDVYKERGNDEYLTIKTDFERKHLEKGKIIKYLKFCLPESDV